MSGRFPRAQQLYLLVAHRLIEERMTFRQLARVIKVSASTFSRMKVGRDITATTYIALLEWLAE